MTDPLLPGAGRPDRGNRAQGSHSSETGDPFRRFGFGRWGGHGPFGHKARRGDTRAAVLLLLTEGPHNGYQLMQEIEARSGGVWRPSPGATYPALQQLGDEGLIEPAGKRYSLTAEGRVYVDHHRDELGVPWETMSSGIDDGVHEVRLLAKQVVIAAMQVMAVSTSEQTDAARRILVDARKSLYRLLAEDDN